MKRTSQNNNSSVPYRSIVKILAPILLVSFAIALVLVEGRGQFTLAQTRQSQGKTKAKKEAELIARGKYIVEVWLPVATAIHRATAMGKLIARNGSREHRYSTNRHNVYRGGQFPPRA